jgi:hypothetical protein
MSSDSRQTLLNISASLDQMLAGAEAVLAGPGDAELTMLAHDMREWVVTMQAKVEEKLERGQP